MRELELERGRLQRQLDRLQRLRLETETDDETPVVWVSLFKGEQLLLAGGYHKPLGLVYQLLDEDEDDEHWLVYEPGGPPWAVVLKVRCMSEDIDGPAAGQALVSFIDNFPNCMLGPADLRAFIRDFCACVMKHVAPDVRAANQAVLQQFAHALGVPLPSQQ